MTAEPVASRPLRLVDDPEIERLKKAIAAMQVDLENSDADLKAKRRRITWLENELAEKRRVDSQFETAKIIFDYWRMKCCPKARTFSEDRQKAVIARLKDKTGDDEQAYPPRFICEAIVGASIDHYVDEHGKHFLDLELVCRNGRMLERFHESYVRWKTAQRDSV